MSGSRSRQLPKAKGPQQPYVRIPKQLVTPRNLTVQPQPIPNQTTNNVATPIPIATSTPLSQPQSSTSSAADAETGSEPDPDEPHLPGTIRGLLCTCVVLAASVFAVTSPELVKSITDNFGL